MPSTPTEKPLVGRLAVVTGASSGIGEAVALRLGALGADVLLGARRLERLEALASQLGELGVRAEALPLDITNAESCRRFSESCVGRPRVDVLVNNAGKALGLTHVVDDDETDWRDMIEANVMGLMRLTRLFLPKLIEQGDGDIVHVSSVAGLQPYAKGAVYCASKAAVEAFARALRLELLGTNVRELVIQPGMVETEFSDVRFHGDRERAKKVYEGVTPLGAEDVAECIAFFVTRPPHVCIQTMLVMPTAQAAAGAVHRRKG